LVKLVLCEREGGGHRRFPLLPYSFFLDWLCGFEASGFSSFSF